MSRFAPVLAFALLVGCASRQSSLKALVVDYEVGPAAVLSNGAQYGASGTFYSKDDVNQGKTLAFAQRASVEIRPFQRHALVLLYAPFALNTRATLDRDLTFRSATFEAGRTVDHRYVFDGYRATYLYRALDVDRFTLDLGGSLQVRTASVSFTDVVSGLYAQESDIGVVPALRVSAVYRSPWRVYARADVDALNTFGVAGNVTGGLYDAALTLGMPVHEDADFFLRLRYLGGGAHVPDKDLYNRAGFAFATLGFRADLVGLLD